MKSKAKQKTFINNMITYAIVVGPFLYLCDHDSFIKPDSRYPGRVKPWTCRIYVCRCFFRGIVFKVHEGCY